ncbi:MAG: LysM peptidoglycan-binding domain-containing protein [Herminiimonas sp.]|nr:LysM peptidoglycan-binding domain-containing protein [Herminiimonas sp.]
MPLKSRSNFLSFGFKTVSAAVISALLVLNADAAGLGKLTVLSSLGQPLNAEIELTAVSKDEAGSLVPKLASADAFRQANIDLNPALFTLRFAIEQRSGRQIIRVTSAQPINEPFVDLLLELGGANGRLLREYTFLLDPADMRSAQAPQVAAPVAVRPAQTARTLPAQDAGTRNDRAAVPAPSTQARNDRPATADRAPAAPVAPVERATRQPAPAAARPNNNSGEYRVRNGDSLSKIAGQLKPEGVSLDQMLVALYRANPDSFGGNNMNRLRAGQILSVPDAGVAAGIANPEARGVIIAQAADFNAYRNKLAGQVATAAPQKSADTSQSATGKITAKIEEKPTAANEARDKLQLSKAGGADTGKGSTISAGSEDKIASDKAAAEASARVKALEKNVNDLQNLLALKNKDMAEQQNRASVATAPAAKPETTAPVASVTKPPVAAPAANAAQATPAASAPTVVAIVTSDKPVPAVVPPILPKSAAPAIVPPVAGAPVVPKPVLPKPMPVPADEPGLFDDPLGNPIVLGAGALLVALLGGAALISARRKKKAAQFQDSIIADSSLKANSLFGSTGGQSVDTNNSVFNSSFSPSVSQLDSNEVDPVAEADVYIAYGRDAQAEEILKEALRTQPERNAVRLKLLEIYANRKDTRTFETVASELYGTTKGQGEDWLAAATMGLALDPSNPMYASGNPPDAPAVQLAKMTAPTQPLDEPDDLEALLASTQADTKLSLESGSTLEHSSYFGNTTLAAEAPMIAPMIPPAADLTPLPVLDIEPPATKPVDEKPHDKPISDGLDFDLAGLGFDDVATVAPVTKANPPSLDKPAPVIHAPMAGMDGLDFDFLDDLSATKTVGARPPDTVTEVPMTAKMESAPLLLTDDDDLMSGLPNIAAPTVASRPPVADSHDAMDFDLSDITLELDPAVEHAHRAEAGVPVLDHVDDVVEETYSNAAEMSTKLDLALAYQEIGDKEGARELLDEVVKGGTSDQADRARGLLSKLG